MLLRDLIIFIATVIYACHGSVQCPGGQYQCPDGTTCCQLSSGQYGCCPMEHAVCCSDHMHCCPSQTTCDLPHGRCTHSDGHQVPWASKLSATRAPEIPDRRVHGPQGSAITCADHQSQCPDGTTCCLLTNGHYGCCPMPTAVCCSDHIHCCPSGSTCDLPKQSCDHGDGAFTAWHTKFPAHSLSNGIICPDGASDCPSGSTCCRMPNGAWGCCPMSNAVCCTDHIHCCPHGARCDPAHTRCIQSDRTAVPWATKVASRPVATHLVAQPRAICSDASSTCPNEATCCERNGEGHNCCPHVNGVCCSDKEHCCPKSTHCDIANGRCIVDGAFMVPWTNVFGSNTLEQARVQEKLCSDGSYCAAPGTCCRARFGHQYRCCGVPNAVCCGTHCCPQGYRCARGPGAQCIKDALFRPELEVQREELDEQEENRFSDEDFNDTW